MKNVDSGEAVEAVRAVGPVGPVGHVGGVGCWSFSAQEYPWIKIFQW